MRVERSSVFLKDARFHAYHGVLLQEREVGGDFLVSVRCSLDVTEAMEHDTLEGTLDYGVLYDLVRREMDIPSQLLEHVAGRIGQAVFDQFPEVASVDLTVVKVNPPLGADCSGAGVELHLINDKTGR